MMKKNRFGKKNLGCAGEVVDTKAASQASGLLGSFVKSVGTSVMGTAALTREDIQPALVQLKRKLMERNVAEEIAAKCVLLGLKLGACSHCSMQMFCKYQSSRAFTRSGQPLVQLNFSLKEHSMAEKIAARHILAGSGFGWRVLSSKPSESAQRPQSAPNSAR